MISPCVFCILARIMGQILSLGALNKSIKQNHESSGNQTRYVPVMLSHPEQNAQK